MDGANSLALAAHPRTVRQAQWNASPSRTFSPSVMFDCILERMREQVRTRQCVMTEPAEDQTDEDGLTIFDAGRIILVCDACEKQGPAFGGCREIMAGVRTCWSARMCGGSIVRLRWKLF